MRKASFCVVVLFGAALHALIAEPEKREDSGPSRGEVTPVDSAWSALASGLEVQVRVPRTELPAPTESLPVVVWFRNPTDESLTLQTVAPAFTAHGELEVRDAADRPIAAVECRKKHHYEAFLLEAGQVRGFYCDALMPTCRRIDPSALPPGKYRVGWSGAGWVEVQVR